MAYTLLLRFTPGDGPQPGTPEFDAELAAFDRFGADLRREGLLLGGAPFESDGPIRTVRRRAGAVETTEEVSRDVVFCTYVIDAPDDATAMAWAARLPHLDYGSVEVRRHLDG